MRLSSIFNFCINLSEVFGPAHIYEASEFRRVKVSSNTLNFLFIIVRLNFFIGNLQLLAHSVKVRGLDGWPDEAFPRNFRYKVEMLETALGAMPKRSCCRLYP